MVPIGKKKAVDYVKGNVLDIGCGAGRHALYLQNQGFEVVGIDVSPLAIKVCKQRGLKLAKELAIEKITEFQPSSIDTVILFGNNFGLFHDYETAQSLLQDLAYITSEDAYILAETRNPYQTDNPAHHAYHERNKRRGRMGGQIRIRNRFKQYIGPWLDYLMVSKEEMKDILTNTSQRILKFIDGDSPQYIAVLEE